MFLEAESLGEFLNQADYATELVAYDRRMLEDFQETKTLIEEMRPSSPWRSRSWRACRPR